MVTVPIKLEPQTRYARMGQEAILVHQPFLGHEGTSLPVWSGKEMKKVQVLGQGGCSWGPVLKFGAVSACHFGLCSPSWSIPCRGKMIMRCRESASLESLSRETGNSKPAKIGSNSSGDRDNHSHVKVMETRHGTRNLRHGSVQQYHMKLRVETHEKVCKCYTLWKPERRSGKRGVYGAKVNYRLEGEEGRRFSQYAYENHQLKTITLELLAQVASGFEFYVVAGNFSLIETGY